MYQRPEHPSLVIAEHATETRRSIDLDKIEALADIQTYRPIIIREAIEVIKTPSQLQS
jgi:hypothetical protein